METKKIRNDEKILKQKNKQKRENSKRYYKVHDSIIKEILMAKQELISLMSDFMNINLNKKDIENFNGEYRLKINLKTRLLDIIYKIDEEEAFIKITRRGNPFPLGDGRNATFILDFQYIFVLLLLIPHLYYKQNIHQTKKVSFSNNIGTKNYDIFAIRNM